MSLKTFGHIHKALLTVSLKAPPSAVTAGLLDWTEIIPTPRYAPLSGTHQNKQHRGTHEEQALELLSKEKCSFMKTNAALQMTDLL